MVLILSSNIFRLYCVKSRISGGLKAAHGTAQRQTWNLSQVAQVALVLKCFWAWVKLSRISAKSYPICEICQNQLWVLAKQNDWVCIRVENCTKADNLFEMDEKIIFILIFWPKMSRYMHFFGVKLKILGILLV